MFPSHKSKISGRKLHLKVFGQLCEEVKISTSYKKSYAFSTHFLNCISFILPGNFTSLLNMDNLFLHFYYSQDGKMKEGESRENVISDPRATFCQLNLVTDLASGYSRY